MNDSLSLSYLSSVACGALVAAVIVVPVHTARSSALAAKETSRAQATVVDEPEPILAAEAHTLAAATKEEKEGDAVKNSKESIAPASTPSPLKKQSTTLSGDDEEILWFARIIYSETKIYDEQVLIAWIVRNRVDTGYRGHTYKEVALSPRQFSGLQPSDPHYQQNISRTFSSSGKAWKSAVEIARKVYTSDGSDRPFPETVRHFYSPVAVSKDPSWSIGATAVKTITDPTTHAVRFALYDGIQ